MTTDRARRILIVEDEFLVAMHLEDLLSEMGHHVVECVGRLDAAVELAGAADIDLAILDINLSGTKSFPVADVLRQRGIPFLFATGYGTDGLAEKYRNELTLQKPYEPRELEQAIAEVSSRLKD